MQGLGTKLAHACMRCKYATSTIQGLTDEGTINGGVHTKIPKCIVVFPRIACIARQTLQPIKAVSSVLRYRGTCKCTTGFSNFWFTHARQTILYYPANYPLTSSSVAVVVATRPRLLAHSWVVVATLDAPCCKRREINSLHAGGHFSDPIIASYM